jgi:cytochrome b6-f complex iron-sulfur subunit
MNTEYNEKKLTRRSFLRFIGWGSFFAALGIAIVGAVRFLFPRVLFEKPSTFKVGYPDDFTSMDNTEIHVYEKWKKEQSVWIVREKNRIYAVNAKCTHLGCTPNYFADEAIFKCPCHGSQFKSNGINYAGPAPRPLDRVSISISDDSSILIDKSRVYTFKEFDKPGAYLEI